MAATSPDSNALIIFDDDCVLCNRFAQWIAQSDKQRRFKFISLKAASAKNLLPKQRNALASVILLQNNKIYIESNAALHIVKQLSGWKKVLYVFVLFPKAFRNFLYHIVARNRYKWFGKTSTCSLDRSRMLELD